MSQKTLSLSERDPSPENPQQARFEQVVAHLKKHRFVRAPELETDTMPDMIALRGPQSTLRVMIHENFPSGVAISLLPKPQQKERAKARSKIYKTLSESKNHHTAKPPEEELRLILEKIPGVSVRRSDHVGTWGGYLEVTVEDGE